MARLARVNESNIVDWVIAGSENPDDEGGLNWAIESLGGNWIVVDDANNVGNGYIYDQSTGLFSPPEEIEE